MDVAAVPVEAVVAAPVEAGSPCLLTGLVVTPLEPSRFSSSFGLAYALAPPRQVRLLGWARVPCLCFLVLNPDQA